MQNPKKPGFDKRITLEMLREMRLEFLALPKEMSHEARGIALKAKYPQFSAQTLEDYSRIAIGVCADVFQMALDGKLSVTCLFEFAGGWDEQTQKYIAKQYVEQKLTPGILRIMKRLKREHGSMGYAEAISRAKGEIPAHQPRREQKRTLDQLLTELADRGNRWRAGVDMALEMIRDEESAGAVHEKLFESVFILRQLVGDQYDFINARLQRYMTQIRKRVKDQVEDKPEIGPVTNPVDGKILEAEFETKDNEGAAPSAVQET